MSPLSSDPGAKARQLANLRPKPENLVPGAGAWQLGDAPHLVHGARSRRSQNSPEWSPAMQVSTAELEARAGAELRDEDGNVAEWARSSIEAVAQHRVALWRCDRRNADLEARGRLKREDIRLQSDVANAFHAALDREALTLTGRIEATGQLARLMGQADLSKLSDAELADLLAKLEAEHRLAAPPDAEERSRRAAHLLAETGLPDRGAGRAKRGRPAVVDGGAAEDLEDDPTVDDMGLSPVTDLRQRMRAALGGADGG